MILLLSTVALAARPEPPPPVPGECSRSYGLTAGTPLPPGLVSGARVTCSAVAVPLSRQADLLATEAWADALDARCRVDTAAAADRLAVLERERDWWREQAARPAPKPVAPVVYVAAGIVGGVALAVLTEWAVVEVVR